VQPREFRRGKYATLYAYHGSSVSKISAGGHLFVLSDQVPETAKFRTEDEKLPLAARAMPAALADFSANRRV
jgi:hypothetical protein